MTQHLLGRGLFGIAVCLFVAGPAQAKDFTTYLNEQGLTPPPQHVAYRYTVEIEATGEQWDGGAVEATEPVWARLSIDPSRPDGERVQVIDQSLSGDRDSREALNEMIGELEQDAKSDAVLAENFYCDPTLLSTRSGQDASLSEMEIIRETDEYVWLRPSPDMMVAMMEMDDTDKSERKMAKRLAKRLDGTLVLSKPDLKMQAITVEMTRPMTVMLVAKIEAMRMSSTCRIAPNGHAYLANFNMHMAMSALGEGGASDIRLRVSDLEPLSGATE